MVKAYVWNGAEQPFTVQEFPLPQVEPKALLIKMKMATICGSDLHTWRGRRTLATPAILGHEGVGEVYELGKAVKTDFVKKSLSVGDRVVFASFFRCGECYYCAIKNASDMCENYRALSKMTCDKPPFLNGTFSEFVYLRPGFAVFKAPTELSDETLAPVNCALSTMIHGIEKIRVNLEDNVLIQGAGALGLYACTVAKEVGAAKIIVMDLVDERLKMAEKFGADFTINAGEYKTAEERIAKVRALTGGWGADVAINVTGVPSVVPEGLRMLRKAGRYLEAGNAAPNSLTTIDMSWFLWYEPMLMGVRAYDPRHMFTALNFLVSNRDKYPFDTLITHKFALSKINEAFKVADSGKGIRVALLP